jgi:hypothetical protein
VEDPLSICFEKNIAEPERVYRAQPRDAGGQRP